MNTASEWCELEFFDSRIVVRVDKSNDPSKVNEELSLDEYGGGKPISVFGKFDSDEIRVIREYNFIEGVIVWVPKYSYPYLPTSLEESIAFTISVEEAIDDCA